MINRFNLSIYSYINIEQLTYVEHFKYGKRAPKTNEVCFAKT